MNDILIDNQLKPRASEIIHCLEYKFLAAMSSSRSDVVTQFVRPFVRVSVPFFSFSVIEVSFSPKEFQWLSKVCLKFKGSFKDVSRKF